MLWNLIVTAGVLGLIAVILFSLVFYAAYPYTVARVTEQPCKLFIFAGLSSWWLIWPSMFGLLITAMYLGEHLTVFESVCIIGCFYMGKREGDRIIRYSLKRWAAENGYRIEGESAPEGS